MSSIEERVKKIVVEQLGVKDDEVSPSASFVDDLGADSLDTVELVMALEEEFECEIPDEEAARITSVQQAIDYIKTHVKSYSRRARMRAPPGARCRGCAPPGLVHGRRADGHGAAHAASCVSGPARPARVRNPSIQGALHVQATRGHQRSGHPVAAGRGPGLELG